MTFAVLLRLTISLAVVIGGLLAVRWWGLRGGGRTRGIRVVARASLGRTSSVAVVDVAGHRYLVGAGEQTVNLIAELPPDAELDPGADPLVGADEPQRAMTDGSVAGADFNDEMPRIGFLASVRRMTTRVPREVRIHGVDN